MKKNIKLFLGLTATSLMSMSVISCGGNYISDEQGEKILSSIGEVYKNNPQKINFPRKTHAVYGIKTTSTGFQPHKAPDEFVHYEGAYDLDNNCQFLAIKNDDKAEKYWIYYQDGNLISAIDDGISKTYKKEAIDVASFNFLDTKIYKILNEVITTSPYDYLQTFIKEAKNTTKENVETLFTDFAKFKNKHAYYSDEESNLTFNSYVEITDGTDLDGRNYESRHECYADIQGYLMKEMKAKHFVTTTKGDIHTSILSSIYQYYDEDVAFKYPNLEKFDLKNN